MTKSKFITVGLIGIIFIGLLLVSGCLAPATTNADGTAATTTWYDQYGIFIFIIIIFGLMYLFMIRPQRKKQKEQQQMMSELQKGDDVMTTAGIYGRIESIDESTIVLKLESGATMRVVRSAIAGKRARE